MFLPSDMSVLPGKISVGIIHHLFHKNRPETIQLPKGQSTGSSPPNLQTLDLTETIKTKRLIF
jgi:hypothetical protein